MIPTPVDPFEQWLRLPVTEQSPDPRFEVWRARPEDFERVYDVVDAAFGRKRPRALYDWLYLHNPSGIARCWITTLRETGAFIKVGSGFPWPIWRDREVLMGSLGGDAATLPEWQRKGLSAVRRHVRRSHPWHESFCSIAGPNEGSQIVIRKSGHAKSLLGYLRGGVAVLRTSALLSRFGMPAAVGRPAGALADAVLSLGERSLRPSARNHGACVERISRFAVDYDDVTERAMHWPLFWCPHNAEFLNWRYLDHPVEEYVGLALVEDERPSAYAVVRLAGEAATLSEFAVETHDHARAARLMLAALDLAREAGCAYLSFFGSPAWRHWRLFRRAGFLPYRSQNQLEARYARYEPEVHDLQNWQVMPGDRDYR